jgi:transcriptional antiterminator RfaH
MEQWYVLHTRPHLEFRVARVLKERDLEIYLPVLSVKTSGEVRQEPFFPCYLFARIDLMTMSRASWQWTSGLRGLVTFDDQPIPLPEDIITALQYQLAQQANQAETAVAPFAQGEVVRITTGPFANMLATFNGPTTPGQRVQILLKMLGQLRRVSIEVSHLEKAPVDETEHKAKPLPKGQPLPKGEPLPKGQPRRTRGRGRRIRMSG